MLSLSDAALIGFLAFFGGAMWFRRMHRPAAAIREAVRARMLVVDGEAYAVVRLRPTPGRTTAYTWSEPAAKPGELVVLPGGRGGPEDAA